MNERKGKQRKQKQTNEQKERGKETMWMAELLQNPDATRHHLILDFTVIFLRLEQSQGKVNKWVIGRQNDKNHLTDSSRPTSSPAIGRDLRALVYHVAGVPTVETQVALMTLLALFLTEMTICIKISGNIRRLLLSWPQDTRAIGTGGVSRARRILQSISGWSGRARSGNCRWLSGISSQMGAGPLLLLTLVKVLVNDQGMRLHFHKGTRTSTDVNHLILDAVRETIIECMCEGRVIPTSICRILHKINDITVNIVNILHVQGLELLF